MHPLREPRARIGTHSRVRDLMTIPAYRPTWVEISTEAFQFNVRQIKKFIGPNVSLMAVLKADAYGHGAEKLAPFAIQNGAAIIGVSSLEEGIALREAGIGAPILNLGGIYPLENFSVAIAYNLIPAVASFEAARTFHGIAVTQNKEAAFHLKVDTGMGRLGVSVAEAKRILAWVKETAGARVLGIFSHFSSADTNPVFSRLQMKRFGELKKIAEGNSLPTVTFHLANTAGMIRYKNSHLDMVRPGLAIYGDSLVPVPDALSLLPVLSWFSRIIFLKKVPKGTPISYGRTFVTKKESRIATLPVGYADGVPRSLSNRGQVLVSGKRCPIIGRVTMDQIMVDVTGLPVRVGEPAVLVGAQQKEKITIGEMAKKAGTISYEIFCGISKRVPRVYR